MYKVYDPVRDAERYYDDLEEKLERRPKCTFCGEHIQEEYAMEINGEFICRECESSYAIDIVSMIKEDYLVSMEDE